MIFKLFNAYFDVIPKYFTKLSEPGTNWGC